MTEWTTPEALELGAYIRPGDAIVSGQACGEPTALIEALIAQRHALGGVSLFTGSSFSGLLKPEHADAIRFLSMGALGSFAGTYVVKLLNDWTGSPDISFLTMGAMLAISAAITMALPEGKKI